MVSTSKSYLPTDPSASSCPNCVISEESLTSTSYTPSTSLNEGTTYYWQVQAYEWGGSSVTEQGEYSSSWSFTTKTISEKPGAFTLSGEARLDGSNPYNHLSWTASSEATSYDVYRDGSHYYDLATLGTTFDNIEVTLGTTYTYFIRATNAQGSTDSNTVTVTTKIPKFSTTAPPPSHQSPSNGATVSTTPTIRWSSVPDADAYGLYISEPPYGSSNLVVDTTVYGTSYPVPSGVLDPRVLYYWNMNSYNDAGWGDCSSSWSFTTETPISIPDPPTPQSPGSSYEPGPTISTLTPLFWWTDVDDADEYAFSVSKYPYGSSNVIYNKQGLTSTSWTIPPGYLEEGEKYRWNMQAHNSAGWSEVSSTLHFQTSGVTDAEIVSYSPSSLTEVEVGKSISLSVTIKNTGNTAWQFIAGASVWNHATGSLVADYEKTLTTIQPGQQTTASWSHPVQAEGDYRVQFGAWKQKPYTSSNLLDKKPDPSQVLIWGIVVQDKSVTLTIYVREGSASGPVIAGARVTGQDEAGKSFDKTTSTSGYVTITGAPGTWSFTASKTGYLPEAWEQSITSTCTKNAYLQPDVSDTAERSSIEINIEPFGAKVYLDGNYLGESSSSMFIIEDVQAGEHSLRIAKTGFMDWKFTVLLAAGERKTLRVTLEEYILETGGLRVRVRDENGDPVAEAEVVSIDEPEDQSTLRDVTDSTGKCVWEDILTGSYSIRVSKDGYIDQVVSVKVKPKSTKTVEVTLVSLTTIDDEPMLVSLCLHVVSSTGEPLGGVIVTGEYRDGDAFEENTDSNGYVTLTGAPGEWTLSASKIGYKSKTWHAIVTSSTTENLILQPEHEDVTLTLYVHEDSASGTLLSGVSVTGSDGDGNSFSKTTNSQGYVTIAGAPGSWSFSASKSGYDANTWSQSIISTCTKNAYLQQVELPIPGSMIPGIDVSLIQGNIKWERVAESGCKFSFVRASQGDFDPPQMIDNNFKQNMDGGSSVGIVMGAYHVVYPYANDAVESAQFFVHIAGDYLKLGYLRPALDLENDIAYKTVKDRGKEYLSNWITTWMSTVEKETGIEPIIYVSENTVVNHLESSIAQYDLWIAKHTIDLNITLKTGIWDRWAFWQYSDAGSVPGIAGNVDLNLFNGDSNELDNFVISFLTVVPSGFLTLPFIDPGITIQQGWRYTAPIGPNPDDPYAHNGIDYIKGVVNQPSTWQPFDVVAAADGVAMCSSGGGYGDFVIIRHTETDGEGRNYFTLYGHLGSIEDHITYRADRFTTDYENWTPVSRGEKIGVAGSTGVSDPSGVHLHFEVMRGGYAQNKVDSYDIYHTRDYYPGGDRYVGYGPNCLWLADFISLPLNEAGRVILIEPLQIAPSGPYFVGDTLTATFTVKNIGDASITLDKLLFGGRFNGDELPGGGYPDFTRESVTLRSGETYRYEGTLALPEPGEYEFFIAYYIGNPTEAERAFLDENNWNTAIELGAGLSDADRTRSLIVYPVEADEIEGSGEVTVKPLFEITDYSVSPSEVRIGEEVSVSVLIKNNDDTRRTFYGVLNVKDPDENWVTGPDETISLDPITSGAIIFYWPEKEWAVVGEYSISIVIWTEPYKGDIIEIPNAFKVVVAPFLDYYVKESRIHERQLNYGTSTHLVTISRESLNKHQLGISLWLLESPITSAAIYFIKNALEVTGAVLETALSIGIYANTGIVIFPPEAEKLLKPLMEKALTGENWDDIYFGGSLSESGRALMGYKLIFSTAESLGYVNFIVVETEGGYDVYAVTNHWYESGKLKEVNYAVAYYIGRYNKLPEILYEKLQFGS